MKHESRYSLVFEMRNRGYRTGVEVGVFSGRFSAFMLKRMPELTLYSVDPFKSAAQTFVLPIVNSALKRLEPFGSRSVVLIMPSVQAATLFADESLDFVYIDGDHSYDAVRSDLYAWYPKIRDGGLLFGDDYKIHGNALTRGMQVDESTPLGKRGVIPAVTEFCEQHAISYDVTWPPTVRRAFIPNWYFYVDRKSTGGDA